MPHSGPQPLRIAIDTGGTFTDCVWVDRVRVRMLKVFSTPDDPSRAIAEALEKIGWRHPLILLHGTTVGTNTLLQRKGARVALVATAGFEDVIEIGRQARPKLYDFFFDRIEPLVPAELRFGVDERTGSDGEILREPSPAELHDLRNSVVEKKLMRLRSLCCSRLSTRRTKLWPRLRCKIWACRCPSLIGFSRNSESTNAPAQWW
jgi:N-methylhydantoinase A